MCLGISAHLILLWFVMLIFMTTYFSFVIPKLADCSICDILWELESQEWPDANSFSRVNEVCHLLLRCNTGKFQWQMWCIEILFSDIRHTYLWSDKTTVMLFIDKWKIMQINHAQIRTSPCCQLYVFANCYTPTLYVTRTDGLKLYDKWVYSCDEGLCRKEHQIPLTFVFLNLNKTQMGFSDRQPSL